MVVFDCTRIVVFLFWCMFCLGRKRGVFEGVEDDEEAHEILGALFLTSFLCGEREREREKWFNLLLEEEP